MGKANFSVDCKRDAVAQITERGYPVAEVSKRLGVSPHALCARKREFSQPFGGDDKNAEIRRLKRELLRFTDERGILSKPPRNSPRMQSEIRVRRRASSAILGADEARCLRIHPSGIFAWLKNSLIKRAKEDVRQTELLRKA